MRPESSRRSTGIQKKWRLRDHLFCLAKVSSTNGMQQKIWLIPYWTLDCLIPTYVRGRRSNPTSCMSLPIITMSQSLWLTIRFWYDTEYEMAHGLSRVSLLYHLWVFFTHFKNTFENGSNVYLRHLLNWNVPLTCNLISIKSMNKILNFYVTLTGTIQNRHRRLILVWPSNLARLVSNDEAYFWFSRFKISRREWPNLARFSRFRPFDG